jgi:hypothetical protein
MSANETNLKMTDEMERQLVTQELAGGAPYEGDEVDARIVRLLVAAALVVAVVLLTLPLL